MHLMKEQGLGKKIVGNIIWNFFGQGWLLILAFIATPFIVHGLEVYLYGIYILISVVIDYFAFLQFGMGAASVKYIAQYLAQGDEDKIRMIFWTGAVSHFFMGLLGMIILIVFAPLFVDWFFHVPSDLRETALFALRVGSIGFLISMLSGMTSGVIRALGRFDLLNIMGIIFGTLQIAATVLLLILGFSLKEIIIANVAVQSAGLYCYWVYAKRLLPFLSKPVWDTNMLLHLFKFGGFVTISGIVGPILTNIEKIFLTALRSVSALTYYAVPFSLINRLSVIPSSFSSVLFPTFSFLQESDQEQINRDLHYRSTLYLFLIYIVPLVFFIFFGRPFLAWWMGIDFAEKSTMILIILGFAGLINAVAYPSITCLQAMGKPQLPATFHVIEIFLYIPAGYFLIKTYGGIGAAFAWFLRVLVDTILLQWASCRLLRVSLFRWGGQIMYRGALPIFIISVLFLVLRSFELSLLHPVNIGGILLIFIIYSCVLWKWVLDADTRGRFLEILKGA